MFIYLVCVYENNGITMVEYNEDINIVMVDINERAVQLAFKNAELNAVTNVEVIQSDRFSAIEERSFAAIVTNPPIRAGKPVVHKIFEESKNALFLGGELWVVIQKKQGAPSAKRKLETLFSQVDVVARDKGYFVLRALNS